MTENYVTQSLLNEVTASVENDLTQAAPEVSRGSSAHLTGLELMGFLALKVVLPIACGLVSRSIYDLYKHMQTKKQAAEAEKELLAKNAPADPVDEATIQKDISEMLVREGLSESKATEVVQRALAQLKARLQPAAGD